MDPIQSEDETAPLEEPSNFDRRPPSTEWERISLAHSADHFVWVWFKPAHLQHGFNLMIPDETFQSYPHLNQMTFRALLTALEIEPESVSIWYLSGVPYEGHNGTSPYFDQPIPEPVAGADPNIHVYIKTEQTEPETLAPSPSLVSPTAIAPTAGDEIDHSRMFDQIATDWHAVLKLEKQLPPIRKKLTTMMSRLNSLNRDLTPEENSHGSRQDVRDWQVARRWLRDTSGQLSRQLKDHDIGETSSAGKKEQLRQMYEQFVVPRKSIDNILQMQREYESYRKRMQMLLNNMNSAYSSASQDGERRAQKILNQLAVKVRAAKSKRL